VSDYRALDQSRKAIQFHINEDPESIIIFSKPIISDGQGGYVDDPFSIPVPRNIKGRISKEHRFPDNTQATGVGLTTAGSWYLLVDWKTEIYKDEIFEARDRNWRIGPVAQIKEHGGVIAYEAPLIEAETAKKGET
jgi:hypothetical protein